MLALERKRALYLIGIRFGFEWDDDEGVTFGTHGTRFDQWPFVRHTSSEQEERWGYNSSLVRV